ncbi:MAG: protein kinase [Archangiaceae bacterium]|nr:protein kinase [Archangiaceae bacterium]
MSTSTRRLGKYQILSRLSVGGMAEIFLATYVDSEGKTRLVTLKRILPDLRERDEFVNMFVNEARITASLNHPNIAQVHELGQERDDLFIAMEFIAGQSLASIIRRCHRMNRPVPMGFTAMVGRDLCKALDAAHNHQLLTSERAPIIHRDVSPGNVMVTYDGVVKVIDFGVAKATNTLSRTMTGNIKGSHGYMSPEQARGAPLDARSDLFSAGAVLHELMTGRPLFLRDSELATFRGILRDDIPAPIAMNPGVPKALSEAVMVALARNPDARYPSANKMARALQGAIPSLISTPEEAGALMGELFSDAMQQTRALFALAEAKAPVLKLEVAAAKLQEPVSVVPNEKAPPLGEVHQSGTDAFGRLPTGVMRLKELPDERVSPFDSAASEPTVEGAVVLSVDDSEISRDFIEAHLETHGFPVLHCGSAEEALALCNQRLPDLILLDVVMPGMNGFQLCRKLRELSTQRPFLPIVFLTAGTSFEERIEGLTAGGDDMIRKPFVPEELVALVRAHLKRAQFLELQHAKVRNARKPAARPRG